ncbi:hypothetical protein ACFOUR_09215 [Halovivax cerinus]|uniref:Lipoprotein n=2 Tax=Halovivax cerinus TaxID=1487865 RepID=A0ABD5NPN2_9EURY
MVSRVSVVVVLLTVLGSGCVTGPVSSTDTEPAAPLPEKPDTLTERTVSNYTTTYEATTIYNRYVDDNPTNNQLSCRSDVRVALESAFVVRVQCTGGVQLAGGIMESDSHVDVAASVQYYVSDDTTIRIDTADFRAVRHQGYQPDGSDRTGFTLVNLANDSAAVHVELERNGSASPLHFEYDVDPYEGVAQLGLPFEYGTTREMRIQTDDSTATAEFTSERIEFDAPTVGYILPDGNVRITAGPSEL